MKLFLTSNGFYGNSIEKDFWELVGDRKNLKVAIIPNASDPIEWVPEKEGDLPPFYVAKLTHPNDANYGKGKDYHYFKDKGHDVVIVDLKEDPVEIKKKLESVDIIDVVGGDANWLLDWAKKSQLGTYLKGLLDKGVVYVGTSAGCGLPMHDIGLTWWNREQWADTDHIGFGIVDFVVIVHQKESDTLKSTESLIERKKYFQSIGIDFPWKLYLVQDGQAVKVDGYKIEHIGPGIKKSI